MKKLITIVCSLCLAVMMLALSACGGGSSSGSIKGNYKTVDATSYAATAETLKNAKVPFTPNRDEEDPDKAAENVGFSLSSKGEIAFTIDGKKASIGSDATLKAINGDDSALVLSGDGKIKMDDKFIDTIVEFAVDQTRTPEIPDIGKVDLTLNTNLYLTDKIYVDYKVSGLSDKIKALIPEGLTEEIESGKYSIDLFTIFGLLASLQQYVPDEYMEKIAQIISSGDLSEQLAEFQLPDYETISEILEQVGIELAVDNSNGLKIKVATNKTFKEYVSSAVEAANLGDYLTDLDFKTFNFEFYLALDKDNVVTEVAANTKIDVSAKLFGKELKLNADATVDLSFEVPTITLPSFEDYAELKIPTGIVWAESTDAD